ncbi:MAG: gliding motility lipoprotein GldD [Bacteroidetes bacterium]|nr:gliding motility lipoprotein GldD [Bacteroidota bacterium]MDA0879309.1 gliding motility lipoprotein GldD [Bacteroidota bacterium]MDA1114918.1 gliding motility lipoprotein GldD [Bacteroidota bacterium]
MSLILTYSCEEALVPKPKAYLRLSYPEARYILFDHNSSFSFEKNIWCDVYQSIPNVVLEKKQMNLVYSAQNAILYCTYASLKTSDLKSLLLDAQTRTQKHTIKADAIEMQPYQDEVNKVYGMLYDVSGNAASPVQFYVTDSINHFLSGALYFSSQPNYDSILPAIDYLRSDVRKLLETLRWKTIE